MKLLIVAATPPDLRQLSRNRDIVLREKTKLISTVFRDASRWSNESFNRVAVVFDVDFANEGFRSRSAKVHVWRPCIASHISRKSLFVRTRTLRTRGFTHSVFDLTFVCRSSDIHVFNQKLARSASRQHSEVVLGEVADSLNPVSSASIGMQHAIVAITADHSR